MRLMRQEMFHAAESGPMAADPVARVRFFRVFQYLTFRAVMAAMTALLIGLAGPYVIRAPDVSSRSGNPSGAMAWKPT